MVLPYAALIQSQFSDHADSVMHQAAKKGARGMGTHADLAPYSEGTSHQQKGSIPTSLVCQGSPVRAHLAISNIEWELS